MTLRGCILCDIHDERGEWFGLLHDRQQWNARWDWVPNDRGGYDHMPAHREAMALAHNLVLAPGGDVRTGPWVPWRDTARDDGPYDRAQERVETIGYRAPRS